MSKWANLSSSPDKAHNRQSTKGGSYSLTITALVLAILIVMNLFVSALPSSLTKYDISSSKLYSITSNTKVVVNSLEQDVTIYWIVQSGSEDQVIENLLDKYENLSEHIQIVKKNPDIYPTFAEQYTNERVQNNSLVVECGDKYRYIGIDDIYLGDLNIYSGTYNASDFDGEGAITSAIDYVTSSEYPQIYLLEGHGENTLPSSFSEQIEKGNMETKSLSLLTTEKIPGDASCVVIYAPERDLSEEERDLLADYVSTGGKLWVSVGPTETGTLENLYALLESYGITVHEGIVVDSDPEYYLSFGGPLALIPTMESHSITNPLIEERYSVILPFASGLTTDGYSSKGTVSELLTTSYNSFSKIAGYSLDTYDYEDGDTEGPFALAVSITDNSGGQICWFTSGQFLNDNINAFSAGANLDIAMNSLSELVGESEAMAIRSKSLNYNYLTISTSATSLLKILMIGIFPLTYLGIGICVVLNRRRTQNETD